MRDLDSGGVRIYLEFEYRRVYCRRCKTVKRETLAWLASSARFTKRFEQAIGHQCKEMTVARAAGLAPKAILRADKGAGIITLGTETTLRGIPSEAWAYKLGNRCALEWILDQYKEKKPKDPTIREKFNTYRFADYKEKVIDLLARVTTVSIETVRITQAMKGTVR